MDENKRKTVIWAMSEEDVRRNSQAVKYLPQPHKLQGAFFGARGGGGWDPDAFEFRQALRRVMTRLRRPAWEWIGFVQSDLEFGGFAKLLHRVCDCPDIGALQVPAISVEYKAERAMRFAYMSFEASDATIERLFDEGMPLGWPTLFQFALVPEEMVDQAVKCFQPEPHTAAPSGGTTYSICIVCYADMDGCAVMHDPSIVGAEEIDAAICASAIEEFPIHREVRPAKNE